MSEEKVSYRIVTENNVVIEVEPREAQAEDTEKRLKKIQELLEAKKKEE